MLDFPQEISFDKKYLLCLYDYILLADVETMLLAYNIKYILQKLQPHKDCKIVDMNLSKETLDSYSDDGYTNINLSLYDNAIIIINKFLLKASEEDPLIYEAFYIGYFLDKKEKVTIISHVYEMKEKEKEKRRYLRERRRYLRERRMGIK